MLLKNKGQEGKVKGEVVMDKVIHHDESPGKRSFDLGMVWPGGVHLIIKNLVETDHSSS